MDPSQGLAAEYSTKAVAYARHWAPVIRPMALPLLQALPLGEAGRVLDVGTGTSSLVPDLRAAAPRSTIIGIDRAEGMLREGGRAIPRSVAVMDIQHLGIRSEMIDAALLVFMLFHTPDPSCGLREVLRVLRPGGAAGIATWGHDQGTPGLSIWSEELDWEQAGPDPRDPSVMQQARMDTEAKLSSLLTAAGYVSLRTWSLTFHHQFTVDNLLAVQIGCGMPARRMAHLSAGAQAKCERRVRARLEKLPREDLAYRPEVLFAIARRPA